MQKQDRRTAPAKLTWEYATQMFLESTKNATKPARINISKFFLPTEACASKCGTLFLELECASNLCRYLVR